MALVHPDWDDDQVRAEVDAITKQREAAMPHHRTTSGTEARPAFPLQSMPFGDGNIK